MFSLAGLDGLITVDGRTVTLKPDLAAPGGKAEAIVVPADSIRAAVIWTGLSESRFGVQYSHGSDQKAGASALELMWVRFNNSEKEWWDAMASAVMKAARRAAPPDIASPDAAGTSADTRPTAPPSFDGWLNRTLGLDT